MDFNELQAMLEKIVRVKVIRGGKKKILKKSDRKGYTTKDGKEVKITAQQHLKMSKSQKKASIKRKSSKALTNIKRKKSLKKRTF